MILIMRHVTQWCLITTINYFMYYASCSILLHVNEGLYIDIRGEFIVTETGKILYIYTIIQHVYHLAYSNIYIGPEDNLHR